MRILHIANDFAGSKVYRNLFQNLDQLEVEQTIYTAVRKSSLIGKNSISFTQDSKIYYQQVLGLSTRLLYPYKIFKVRVNLEKYVDLRSVNLIHAHTWYSDGGVAYELFKSFGIPYVITIRSTDVKVFLKYLVPYRKYGRDILENASNIIFVTPASMLEVYQHSYYRENDSLRKKSLVIPNGVDGYWIENSVEKVVDRSQVPTFLYIGRLLKQKNVVALIKSVIQLNKDGFKCRLVVVGDGEYRNYVLDKSRDYDFIEYLGPVDGLVDLRTVMQKCDYFVMTSYQETFGLVYLEALSQGLPVMHVKGEAIDGMYSGIGEIVVNAKVENIVKGLRKLVLSKYEFNPQEILKNHDWRTLAGHYKDIYKQILL